MTEREASDIWILPAAAIVAAITALRIVLLALSPSDLHALESQLWVLARAPAEAPSPLAVWLVRALGWAGDAPWILRLPAPVLHGVAAMVLGSVAERLFGPRMALATALVYVTLPGVALGSALLTPLTVAAPVAAAALALYLRLLDRQERGTAVAVGLALGATVLAHPAGMMLIPCAILAGMVFHEARPARTNAPLIALGAALALAPALVPAWLEGRIWWPIALSGGLPAAASLGWLAAGLIVVPGPIIAAAWLGAALNWRRQSPLGTFLLLFSAPVLAVAPLFALIGMGIGWAAASVLGGLPLALSWMRRRARWVWGSMAAINIAASLALPVAMLIPDRIRISGQPLLAPFAGRAELARTVLDIAADLRVGSVVAGDTELAADLAHAARNDATRVFAAPNLTDPAARVLRFAPGSSDVLLVLPQGTEPPCPREVVDLADLTTDAGAYRNRPQMLYLVPGQCLAAEPE